jgi:NADH-quinone oxidoreductase subunit C/D
MAEKTVTAPLAQLTPEMASLKDRFGDAIQPAEYEGIVIANDRLLEAAQAIRDGLGYDYLSSLTGVDYIDKGYFETVYHTCSIARGGSPLVFKARTPRDVAEIPSVVSVWGSAEFQEREAYDMFGIRYTGHPDLRRILTWEGFAGYPLRKDWKEAYYEQDHKPFDSRWPGGHHVPAEERVQFHDNVTVSSETFNVESFTPEAEQLLYTGIVPIPGSGNGHGLRTDSVVVNLGPQHPSTHGVFRLVVRLSGETVEDLRPVMGYLHRNHEKIGERNTFLQNMPFTDRLDYICSMSNNFGYAVAVEKLMNIKPPERAEYIRIIMAELTRVMNHLAFCGFLTNEMGAFFTPFIYAFEERELILDLFEMASGSRMMCNYFRFGGVARDVSDEFVQRLRYLVFERLPQKTDEMENLITTNEIVRSRAIGVAVLPRADAISLGAAGPLLRASGVSYDVRKAEPYSIYDRFDFDLVTGTNGDVYDRYLVRVGEIRQSIRILKQALEQLPAGEIQTGKKAYQTRVPAGQAYGRVEAPKGELGFYVVSDGSPNPYRYHVRATCFINLGSLATMARGGKLADAIIGLGSIDTTMGEVDR